MAKVQVAICDKCGKDVGPIGVSTCVTYDRETDASGSMDDVWRPVDLCVKCSVKCASELLAGLSPDEGRRWLERYGLLEKGG